MLVLISRRLCLARRRRGDTALEVVEVAVEAGCEQWKLEELRHS